MRVILKNKDIRENLIALLIGNVDVVRSKYGRIICKELTYEQFSQIIDNQSVIKWEDIDSVIELVSFKGGDFNCVFETSISYGCKINTDEPFNLFVTYFPNNPYVKFEFSGTSLSMSFKSYMLTMTSEHDENNVKVYSK